MSGQFTFKGKILNDTELIKVMESSPAIYTRYMRSYLNFAGRTFIGNKEKGRGKHVGRTGRVFNRNVTSFKDGYLRSLLGSLQANRGGNWQRNFVNAVANYKLDREKLEMRAGIIYSNKKLIHEIMEQLETGYSRDSSGYMIIPNYKAISDFHGLKPIAYFHQLLKDSVLRMVFKNGKIFYINRFDRTLMFTGAKNVKIKKQFDFEKAYDAVRPKIEKRASRVLDAATKAAEKANPNLKIEIEA